MSIKSILAATLLIGATLAPAAAMAHPPHHGGYSYVYYPQRHIYYAPQSRYWYWQDRGAWRSGYYLPSAYASFAVGGINIMLDADRPYTRHAYVVERYRPAPRVVYHHNAPRYDHHAYHHRDRHDDRHDRRDGRRDHRDDHRDNRHDNRHDRRH